MLGEYKVSRCSRQCHHQQRPLRDGEWYYSVVIEDGDEYLRRDYSAESWQGPPESAVGWWKSRMPTSDEKKMVLAPPEVLIDLLRQMGDLPGKEKCRYLLALMLMRRRLIRPVTGSAGDDSRAERTEQNEQDRANPLMRVEVVADGDLIEIPTCVISRSEAEAVKNELDELLYCEAEPD